MGVFLVIPSDSDLMHHGVKDQKWGVRRYQYKDGSLTPLGRRRLGIGGPTSNSQKLLSTTAVTVSKGRSSSSRSRSTKDDDFIEGQWRWADDEPSGGSSSSGGKAKNKKDGTQKSTQKDDDVLDGKYKKVKDGESEKSDKTEQGLKSTQEALSGVSKITNALAEQQSKRLQSDRQRAIKEMDVSNMSDDDLQKAINRMTRENKYKELKADRIEYGGQKTIERLKLIGDVAATGGTIVGVVAAIKKAKG